MKKLLSKSELIQQYRRRYRALRSEWESQGWRTHYKEICDYLAPHKGRYLDGNDSTQHNDGRKKNHKIINSKPRGAIRTLSAGLQGGLTSSSRPWFNLTLKDEALSDQESVKNWLYQVREIMLSVFSKSNFYESIHALYIELVHFGTAVMLIEEDEETGIRCKTLTVGEYVLGLDSRYRPDSLYRSLSMSAIQMKDVFGMDKLPTTVKAALESLQFDQSFEVIHVIQPNKILNPSRSDRRGMKFSSCYFMSSGWDEPLREAGYSTIPFVAPRWDATGSDTYGRSPAMDALGDIKMLQKMEMDKLLALSKMVSPPINAPTSLQQRGVNISSNAVNFVDSQNSDNTVRPTYQIAPDLQNIAFELDRVERRIEESFYNPLFLSVLNEDKDMTALEVAKRLEEKNTLLGPILERLQSENHDPIIDRVFNILDRFGLLPPPPPELPQGMALNVEYVSQLAQAQKMLGSVNIEQFVGFVGRIAQADPSTLKKVNFFELIDQGGKMLGIPPNIVRPQEVVEKEIDAEKRQMQMMQMIQAAPQVAGAIKDMGDTPVRGGQVSALDAMTGGNSDGSGQGLPI